jgi:excisionase family DNA binding protein
LYTVFWLAGQPDGIFDYCVYCEYFDSLLVLGIMAIAAKKPTPLPKSERQQVQDLEKLLRRGVPALISTAGERVELPGTVVEVLRTAVEFMSHGQTVTLIPDNQAITTQRAADILGMSRPFFIKQLESGIMAHHRIGNQRRVYIRDVLEFAKRRDKERLAALDLLARDAFEAGLYERNVFPKGGTDE